jgi:acyl-CoA reductase-like NAD-dependent aldehyde dehydrogenase
MALGRKTGGRKPGSLNKATVVVNQVTELLMGTIAQAGEEDIDALQLLQRAYRLKEMPLAVRIECAKAAIKHETPTLASTQQTRTVEGGQTNRIEVVYVDGRVP